MKNNRELTLMKPFMPPLHELRPYLEKIWESRQLTNGGQILAELEQKLCDHLGVKYISLLANGALALILALKELNLHGEIITTPFTSVATALAIYWNNLKPVFVDINEEDLNINVAAIDRAITSETSAVLPVHIFGHPCDIEGIAQIAKKHDLKIVYDAAHCFGVEKNGKSICSYGDLSALSFHATKVFNTLEGGAIVCHDETAKKRIDILKNTGLDSNHQLSGYGINAKMSEIQAAFGIIQLNHIDDVMACRKKISMKYRELFSNIRGIRVLNEKESVKYNYSYFPAIIDPGEFGATRDEVADFLEKRNIFPRKYFSPLVSDYPEFKNFRKHDLTIARKIADNVLCMPLYHDISMEEVEFIVLSFSELQQIKCP
ncbi:MAG: DegT/DnrJ/EryC1/StrS family aminotransferase [Bacteroidales bacterium]|nr:DegT/DnrJ/EryC1/StrS family aminotransferase [Bacteroidales bacterium]